MPRILYIGLRGAKRMLGGWISKCLMHGMGIQYGTALKIWSPVVCSRHPGARIVLGNDVSLHNRLRENMAGILHPTVLAAVEEGAEIRIGNHVGISGAILYCTRQILVEDYVSIGVGARIYDTDFHPLDAEARRANEQDSIQRAPVRICQDAWLGADSMILKGVTVGARSIVASRAVVTRDVPPDCVVAGIPARVVKHLAAKRRT